jgi:hypothetical protein
VAQRYALIQDERLIEMTDPAAFYESPDHPAVSRQPSQRATAPPRMQTDDTLARIVEIESLLEADLARKAKFQKPELQQRWRAELKQLYDGLDRD